MRFRFIPNQRFWMLITLFVFLVFIVAPVAAQDVTPPPDVPPVATFDLQAALAGLIVFLLYVGSLAGALQLAINQLKPLFLDPIKNRKDAPTGDTPDNVYLVYLYVFRTGLTSLAYFYLWGGIAATRAAAPFLPAFIPDPGIAIGTIALVVLGEEIIHPLLERAYILRDVAKLLAEPPEPFQPSPIVNVNVTPGKSSQESIKQVLNTLKSA